MNTAKTNAERQRAFRARMAEQQITEVRGVFAHRDDHAEVKAMADKLKRKRVKLGEKKDVTVQK